MSFSILQRPRPDSVDFVSTKFLIRFFLLHFWKLSFTATVWRHRDRIHTQHYFFCPERIRKKFYRLFNSTNPITGRPMIQDSPHPSIPVLDNGVRDDGQDIRVTTNALFAPPSVAHAVIKWIFRSEYGKSCVRVMINVWNSRVNTVPFYTA